MGPLCFIFSMGVQREVNGEINDGKVDLSRSEREECGEQVSVEVQSFDAEP